MAIGNIINFINNTPWAMEQGALSSMLSVLDGKINNTDAYHALVAIEQHTKFGDANSSSWETDYFISKSGRSYDYLKVSGTLVPRTGNMQPYCGMIPTIRLASIIRSVEADCLILHLDSGGGSTMGTPECAQAVADVVARGVEVIAYTDTQMASAAYWIGSKASSIIASPSSVVGSIGVYSVITKNISSDKSKSFVIRAGSLKAIGHPDLEVSDAELESIQGKVDDTYKTMVAEIASGRGVSVEDIKGTNADYYTASKAPSFLVDEVMTLDELITKAKES